MAYLSFCHMSYFYISVTMQHLSLFWHTWNFVTLAYLLLYMLAIFLSLNFFSLSVNFFSNFATWTYLLLWLSLYFDIPIILSYLSLRHICHFDISFTWTCFLLWHICHSRIYYVNFDILGNYPYLYICRIWHFSILLTLSYFGFFLSL